MEKDQSLIEFNGGRIIEEEEAKLMAGNEQQQRQLIVDDDLQEMAKKAAWSVSSCKPGNGVLSLRDDNLHSYWQYIFLHINHISFLLIQI